jgi:hypothetical protein
MTALISAILLFDLTLAAHRLYSKGGGWTVLLSTLTVLLGVITIWGNLFRQYKQVQQVSDTALASRIYGSSLRMVFCVNVCVLGALGLMTH